MKKGKRFSRICRRVIGTGFLAAALSSSPAAAEVLYEAGFGPGEWDDGDWVRVKSPRWDYEGAWIQREDHIENQTPPDLPPDTLVPVHRAYTAMVLKDEWKREKP